MSTKINLLPDVRLAKLREKTRRHWAISSMFISVIVSAGILIVAFVVLQAQVLTAHNLKNNITSKKQQVASYPNVTTILSAQARLTALPGLYQQRVKTTKLLGILSSIEPTDVDFTAMSVDSAGSLNLSAEGKSYSAAARIARALEQANVSVGSGANANNQPYFTNVQLSAVSLNSGKTAYTITATVSPGAIQ